MKSSKPTTKPAGPAAKDSKNSGTDNPQDSSRVPEIGGRKGPDPTRYGDWEKDGRCVDF